jgi:hypothetical protein
MLTAVTGVQAFFASLDQAGDRCKASGGRVVCCLQVLQAEVNYSDPEGAGFGMAYAERKLRHPKKYRSARTKTSS